MSILPKSKFGQGLKIKPDILTFLRMLFEFHKWQNDKRPGTLHATYLLYGTRKKPNEADGDVEMTDSQSESGLPYSDDVPTATLTLVREEQLQGQSGLDARWPQ